MTPEQKAFYEYGKARGIANERLGILNDATIRTNIEFGELYRKEYKELYDIDEAIRDAWEKRAECRAFVPENERRCEMCKNRKIKAWCSPCKECFDADSHVNWESRKEDE